jgi:hypothetical protein
LFSNPCGKIPLREGYISDKHTISGLMPEPEETHNLMMWSLGYASTVIDHGIDRKCNPDKMTCTESQSLE